MYFIASVCTRSSKHYFAPLVGTMSTLTRGVTIVDTVDSWFPFAEKMDVYITVYLNKLKIMMCLTIVIYVLLIMNMFKNSSLKLEKATFS